MAVAMPQAATVFHSKWDQHISESLWLLLSSFSYLTENLNPNVYFLKDFRHLKLNLDTCRWTLSLTIRYIEGIGGSRETHGLESNHSCYDLQTDVSNLIMYICHQHKENRDSQQPQKNPGQIGSEA